MQKFIPSVLSALEALSKGPTWLLWKAISIFFGNKKSPSPPQIPPSTICSLSDSPYEGAYSQQQRSAYSYPPPHPAAKYSQSQSRSAHQPPSQHTPYQPHRQPSARLFAARAPQVPIVPAVIDPHERPVPRAPQVPVVPVVIDLHGRPVPRALQVPVVPVVIDPRERPVARAQVPVVPIVIERPVTRAPEVSVARVVIDPHEDPKSLRLKATQERDRMRECLKERKEAKARNERQRAKELTRRRKAHRVNMMLLDKEASAKIFQENNQNRRNEVDLHGHYVSEARSYFDISVQGARDREESSLCVIVGKGKHCDDNTPKIKPAILAHGKRLGLSIEMDPRNDGRLIVSFK